MELLRYDSGIIANGDDSTATLLYFYYHCSAQDLESRYRTVTSITTIYKHHWSIKNNSSHWSKGFYLCSNMDDWSFRSPPYLLHACQNNTVFSIDIHIIGDSRSPYLRCNFLNHGSFQRKHLPAKCFAGGRKLLAAEEST